MWHRIQAFGKYGTSLVRLPSAYTPKENPTAPDKEANARVTIREIRRALNEFRDNQRLGIVYIRNRLMASIFVTGDEYVWAAERDKLSLSHTKRIAH